MTDPATSLPKTMLFCRDLRGLTGGHLKFFDYLKHTSVISQIRPALYLTRRSNLELAKTLSPKDIDVVPQPFDADMFFVAGQDWKMLDKAGVSLARKPVVNLIQGFRHCLPKTPLYEYLKRPALRICVSVEVAEAVENTGIAQGPVVAIENGTDVHALNALQRVVRTKRVFVGGLKNPRLAKRLAKSLLRDGIQTDLCFKKIPRAEYLSRLAACEIAVLLPLETEGFFLPAIEAMALGSAVVVPDCIGARQFCLDGVTCLVPERTVGALHAAVRRLWDNDALCTELKNSAKELAARYSLENERDTFHQVIQKHLKDGFPV